MNFDTDPVSVMGYIAAAFHAAGFITYNIQARKNLSVPNPASWSVWAFLAVANALSFTSMTSFSIGLQYVVGAVGCSYTFFNNWRKYEFGKLTQNDKLAAKVSFVTGLVYLIFRSATWANMVNMTAFVISCIPTFEGVRKDPTKERSLPWILWILACEATAINTLVEVLMNKEVTAFAMVTPMVLLVFHVVILLLCTKSRREEFLRRKQ